MPRYGGLNTHHLNATHYLDPTKVSYLILSFLMPRYGGLNTHHLNATHYLDPSKVILATEV